MLCFPFSDCQTAFLKQPSFKRADTNFMVFIPSIKGKNSYPNPISKGISLKRKKRPALLLFPENFESVSIKIIAKSSTVGIIYIMLIIILLNVFIHIFL